MSADAKRMLHWRPTTKQLKWTIAVLIFLAILGFLLYLGYGQEWTGFGQSTREKETTQDLRREKTLWDWMQLLVIPVAVAVGTFGLNQAAKRREEALANQQAQDTAVQSYLDRMSQLLTAPTSAERLRDTTEDNNLRVLARAWTLTVLGQLGSSRKWIVLQFLYDAHLIGEDPVIWLKEADFQRADLREADLQKANLQEANLQEAVLLYANLQETNLQETNLRAANLQKATLRASNLQAAQLQGANPQAAILRRADLGGAHLRGANLRGANLRRAIVIQQQIEQAIGDEDTKLPEGLERPESWTQEEDKTSK